MFIMSKLKIFLLPVFILVLLLPCIVVGQETELQKEITPDGIKIDTASVKIFNNKTNEFETWGYINIQNNTEDEYITWITKNRVSDKTNEQIMLDYFFHHKPYADFNLISLMNEDFVEGALHIIDLTFMKSILPGREFTYMFIKTDKNMNFYKDKVVLLKRKEVESFLKFKIREIFLFPQPCIIIDME